MHLAEVVKKVHESITCDLADLDDEYVVIEGKLCIGRLRRAISVDEHLFKRTASPVLDRRIEDRQLRLQIRARGLLDTIQFQESDITRGDPGPEEVDVEVRAFGVNYKDCLTLLGKMDTDVLGSECSGVVQAIGSNVKNFSVGDRVLAYPLNVFQTHVRAPAGAVVRIPDTMEFPQAAAIFVNFSTAYYSLFQVAHLRKGESILINAAAGATGQALIQVAQYIGADIYVTVGSAAKKDLLTSTYGIPEERIFYSRDTSFRDGVLRVTKGRGVDVVVSSQQGHLHEASWDCVAYSGRFIDIGLKDAYMKNSLPMHAFTKNVSYSGYNLAVLYQTNFAEVQRILAAVLALFEKGKLRPITPIHRYPLQHIEEALRFLQSGKSTGKIIIEIDKAASVPVVQSSHSSHRFTEAGTYVIAGALGGIGRTITRWLVQCGARNLILISRSGGDEQGRQMIDELLALGINVRSIACDIGQGSQLKHALQACSEGMPPIRGCIQAAMVLRDSTFSSISWSDWKTVTSTKVQGSWNLHDVLPAGMEFFIMLSSMAGIFGNVGQSSYCAGNTYQDALARYRISIGEKAFSLDLSAITGGGYVAENKEVMDRLKTLNLIRTFDLNEVMALMEYACNPSSQASWPFQSQVITGFELPANVERAGRDVLSVMDRPTFRHLQQAECSVEQEHVFASHVRTFRSAFTEAASAEAAAAIVAEALRNKVSRVLGIPAEEVTTSSALDSYGVDSLVGLELRNWLSKESNADLAVFDLLGGSTLLNIGQMVVAKSSLRSKNWGHKDEE